MYVGRCVGGYVCGWVGVGGVCVCVCVCRRSVCVCVCVWLGELTT